MPPTDINPDSGTTNFTPHSDAAEAPVDERRKEADRREGPRREDDDARRHLWVELLKYPVLVFSIFLAILGANKMLGIQFGAVASVGTDGVKFVTRTEDVSAQVVQLETQLKDARFAIEVLQKRTQSLPTNAAIADPRFRQRVADLGGTSPGGSSADFARFIAEETEKWVRVVKFAGIKAD